jgi:hypothetical protein
MKKVIEKQYKEAEAKIEKHLPLDQGRFKNM